VLTKSLLSVFVGSGGAGAHAVLRGRGRPPAAAADRPRPICSVSLPHSSSAKPISALHSSPERLHHQAIATLGGNGEAVD